MKVNLKKVKDCRTRLVVEVGPDRAETRFQEVLRQIQREAALPGFREGKAPLDMIEKRFQKEASEETLKSLIPELYHQALAGQKVRAVSLPTISDIKYERGRPLSFAAEFDREPEFSLKNYKGIRIRKVPMEVTDEDLEKSVRSLLESRAQLDPIETDRPVQQGDFVLADIEVRKDDGYEPARKDVILFVESNAADDFCDKVVGAKIDEVREVSVEPTPEEKKQGLVGRKPMYRVWVRGIRQKRVPELDETFAKSLGKDSVEELRQAVRKELAAHKRDHAYGQMREELFSKLLGMASFALPESLVSKQKERLVEQARRQREQTGAAGELSDEERRQLDEITAQRAGEQVRLHFILSRVSEQENIEPDEMELERRLSALAEQSGRPLDEVRQVFEDDIRDSLREAKTVEFLLANAKQEEPKP